VNGTIVCAVEEARSAEAAIRVAARLGERLGMRVLVVGVADPQRRLEPTVEALVERVVADNGLAGLVERRIGHGAAADALAEIAAEEAAELIVVGARPTQIGRRLLSPLARELAAAAPCPVVVAPPAATAALPRPATAAAHG
jgi:nucleotide-binding universal stress UspA family protein